MHSYLLQFLNRQLRRALALCAEYAILLLLGGAGVLLFVVSINWDWQFWAEQTIRQGQLYEIKLDRARILQQIALVALGVPALGFAIWRSVTAYQQAKAAISQADTALRNQLLDRYTNAANLLDASNQSSRRAGLLALERLGLDHPEEYYKQTLQLLAGFVRDTTAAVTEKTPRDVELALDQITRIRKTCSMREDFRIDLEGSRFKDVVLLRYYLDHANLCEVGAIDMQFSRCDLSDALFFNAQILNSRFSRCDLSNAKFGKAFFNCITAAIDDCNLSGASLEQVSGLRPEDIRNCWAWSDNPPGLPTGFAFTNLFNPGTNGEIRTAHQNRDDDARRAPPKSKAE